MCECSDGKQVPTGCSKFPGKFPNGVGRALWASRSCWGISRRDPGRLESSYETFEQCFQIGISNMCRNIGGTFQKGWNSPTALSETNRGEPSAPGELSGHLFRNTLSGPVSQLLPIVRQIPEIGLVALGALERHTTRIQGSFGRSCAGFVQIRAGFDQCRQSWRRQQGECARAHDARLQIASGEWIN